MRVALVPHVRRMYFDNSQPFLILLLWQTREDVCSWLDCLSSTDLRHLSYNSCAVGCVPGWCYIFCGGVNTENRKIHVSRLSRRE